MRETPLKRYAAMTPSCKRMRQSRSTGKPTKAQTDRFEAIKRGPCMACLINESRWQPRCDGEGCDAHHLLSGGRRRGHDYTIALCPYHHRNVRPYDCATDADALHRYGPTLNQSRLFRDTYGADDELLARQNQIYAGNEP